MAKRKRQETPEEVPKDEFDADFDKQQEPETPEETAERLTKEPLLENEEGFEMPEVPDGEGFEVADVPDEVDVAQERVEPMVPYRPRKEF